MQGSRPRAVIAMLATALLIASCTGDPETSTSDPEQSDPAQSPSATPSDTTEAPQAPLAIIVHPSRGAIDVNVATARRVEAGDIRNWRQLGEPAGPIRLIDRRSDPGRLRRVASDVNAIATVPATALDPRVRAVVIDGIDPLAEPERYPLLVPGDEPPRPVTVTVAGDVMLARGVAETMGDDPFAPFRPTAQRLASADLTVANLESSLSQDGAPIQGTDSFGADPEVLRGLERAGFDVLSLANNHVGDYGPIALEQTLRRIDRSSIERVGAGFSLKDASAPTVVEIRGTRIGFVAFNSIGEAPAATASSAGTVQLRMPPRTGPFSRDDLNALTREVRDLAQRVDIVVVIPHWGDQYVSRPNELQRRVAGQLADAGATAVLGGHPHWVQGMEMIDDTLVAYSLGNFIFDMDFSEPTMQGIALELTFWGDRLMAATPVPAVIDPSFAPRFVGDDRGADILDDVWLNSYGSFRP
jgi:poly-gamma-glutamate capsule biosynthesis protein CapA/YwtB (metallophosphatase superfamily)